MSPYRPNFLLRVSESVLYERLSILSEIIPEILGGGRPAMTLNRHLETLLWTELGHAYAQLLRRIFSLLRRNQPVSAWPDSRVSAPHPCLLDKNRKYGIKTRYRKFWIFYSTDFRQEVSSVWRHYFAFDHLKIKPLKSKWPNLIKSGFGVNSKAVGIIWNLIFFWF